MKTALEAFGKLFNPPVVKLGDGVGIASLIGSAEAFLSGTLAQENCLVLAITPGIPHAEQLYDDLCVVTAKLPHRVLMFPPLLDGDKSALGLRIKIISAIKSWSINPYPCAVVAPYVALSQPITTANVAAIDIGKGTVLFNDLIRSLSQIGYNRTPQVETVGDFSVRGGILDVWSPGDEFPIRAEFFGDELESLRTFNAATQISVERLSSATLLPISNSKPESDLRQSYLTDILPKGSTILALEHNEYAICNLLNEKRKNYRLFYTGEPAPPGVVSYPFQTTSLPGFSELSNEDAHHPELFDSAKKRLAQHLEAAKARGFTIVNNDDLSSGFEVGNLIVTSKSDRVFAKRKHHLRKTATNTGSRLNDFDDLEPGEYVVHLDHGIGRFIGSSEIITNGQRSEVFTIEYADGAKLHVPAAHAHLLSRYVGIKGEQVKLHRLDGKGWTKDKKDAEHAIADLAVALLETQAKRELTPGFAYEVNCEGIEAFEASFPYEETPDQLTAITAIKNDLAKRKPMDRLICGDAGYGKTEVAMRAAYIAAMNGKQVAVLAPTTVLAEQHFETFTSRFDGTPIRIESMSRFQSSAVHSGTIQRLATGACDIVIGTHAILSDKIAFRDLGLIIIDEEQRFGVKHKEFLKSLRATADVLTLSATPIPRTLYLSMTGARDLSLLRTPPRERVAVDTKIVTDSDVIVKAAIEAEIARGGQIFFLHNRVCTINKVEKRLQALLPNAKIVVAHGQMDSRTLARKMRAFEQGEYDILLSTTIVESGIDIPRANTILIDHAEMFGLADLYQLRGRVGRSTQEGHAVLLLPTSGMVDSDARERLNALKRHGALGAGFNLAVRDLELRGAGNLLGSQQSGHIAAVGFGLYCQLLNRTIALMKGEKVQEIIDVKLNFDFLNLRIPYTYIEEDCQRLSIIKRFAEAQDERIIKALTTEMRDRFGPLPDQAKEFVDAAMLRVKAAKARIGIIDVKGDRAVLYHNNTRTIAKVLDLKAKSPQGKLQELLKSFK